MQPIKYVEMADWTIQRKQISLDLQYNVMVFYNVYVCFIYGVLR